MRVKLYDHGCPRQFLPKRAHANDVGADVYAAQRYELGGNSTVCVPLGFGVDVPAGYAAWVFPRSSLAKLGIDAKLAPIDPGYTGEVHAILTNSNPWPTAVDAGCKIGQLVFLPCATPEFSFSQDNTRASGAFGSTGGVLVNDRCTL